MEDQTKKDIAIFHQICEANELEPESISEEAKERFPEKFNEDQDVEKLIWTALDHRARALVKQVAQDADLKGDKAEYTIDGDPTAPSFVVNDKNIRNEHSSETADKILEALKGVQMPVRA